MSTATTFSYAQAAKGQSISQAAPSQSGQNQTTPAPSKSSQDIATPTKSGSSVSSVTVPTAPDECESVEQASAAPARPDQGSSEGEPKPFDDESVATTKAPSESAFTSQRMEKPLGEIPPPNPEKREKGSNSSPHPHDSSDGRRKKGKKSKVSENGEDPEQNQDRKENSPQPQPELFEAPIPAVNVWQQRREAQAAKAKVAPPLAAQPPSPANGNVGVEASNSDQKQRPLYDATQSSATQNKVLSTSNKPQKKAPEQARSNGDQSFRRSAPRGSRANENESRVAPDALPPVANAASWPTPETASVETKPQTHAEKYEKDGKVESAIGKSRQKWVPVPFVPTVAFNTSFPARGGPRVGGRAGSTRVGREGTSRGPQNAGVPGANGNGNESDSRAASVAAQASKRVSVDNMQARETRKPATSADAPRQTGSTSNQSNAKPESLKHGRTDPAETNTAQSAAHATNADCQPENDAKPTGLTRDTNPQSSQETAGPLQNGVNHRSAERTRGAGRSRGGHSSSTSLPHQSQPPFTQSATGYPFQAGAPSRQTSQPFSPGYFQLSYGATFPAPQAGNHRGRPNSMSAGRSTNGGRHSSGRPPAIQPVGVSYDPGMYPQPPPLFNYFDTSILGLVRAQIEYYFSIDNLCKDLFLRNRMDSQGFVLLNIITQFKRMQELTSDYNLVRYAGQTSERVELVTGEDRQDRIRRREGWETWVQPMEQRDHTAQNEGPKTLFRHSGHPMTPVYSGMMHGGYPIDAPAVFSPNSATHFAPYTNGDHIPVPMTNGVNGPPASESHLSAAVPEFSPTGLPGNADTEHTASIGDKDANNAKKAHATGKKHEVTSPSNSDTPTQPNGSTHESIDHWHTSQAGQIITNGVNGAHEPRQC
ncbi:hypothetical protein DL762_010642 [Monosporascus cannonballus]|uniref:HTH La-type RNA-binding domain-containing protein n=1 Tax=Monosporascus cannonballus TaxID=155416 RepID=A0ABY0GU36_9PEZI|nr:hypothetical protein DL762_010642 [Monosporascus cannonballus]